MLRRVYSPETKPIGVLLVHTAKVVSRAFDEALAEAGGSLPVWLIALELKTGRPENQRELARAVGVQGATLTHHLNAMEAGGLVTRQRDPGNRRVHQVRLTEAGNALFERMAMAARNHDKVLRTGLEPDDVAALGTLLGRLHRNVARIGPPTS
jgi:MarR family transcriptional regulator, transcriptional regulator for hemolysin